MCITAVPYTSNLEFLFLTAVPKTVEGAVVIHQIEYSKFLIIVIANINYV